jgi:hypothetical protein
MTLKKTLLQKIALAVFCLAFSTVVIAQSSLASARLKPLHGAVVTFGSLTQKDSLVLVCFWATTSDQSISELNAINGSYEKWKKDVKFRLLAVSTDEGTDANRVRPVANMNEWKFDVYTDIDGDLKQAAHATSVPQAVIIKSGKVVYLQSGFDPGSQNYLLQKMRAIAAGKS